MITTAKRLDTVEEYYFSSKLREVRQLQSEGKPIINMGIEVRFDSKAVTDAVQIAMTKNAHQYQSQGLPELRKSMADFIRTTMMWL
jgi:aspartate/methionine/tyrosine aminotransferase